MPDLRVLLGVLRDYQSILGTLLAVAAALLAAPWIGERYARSREYWTRRIDFACEVADFMLRLRTAPEAPPDVLHIESPEFNEIQDSATRLRNRARVLYPDSLHRSLFVLLLYCVVLTPESRIAFCNAIAQFLEAETHGEPMHARLGQLVTVLRFHPQLAAAVARSDSLAPSRAIPSLPPVGEAFADMGAVVTKTLRWWGATRPWHWPQWLRWERDLHRAARAVNQRLNA